MPIVHPVDAARGMNGYYSSSAPVRSIVDRERLRQAVRLMRLGRRGTSVDEQSVTKGYTARSALTHRIDVRQHLAAKRAAMAAHGSQRRGGAGRRALDRFVRLPLPVFWLVFGREWYVEHGRQAPARLDDVFVSLRGSADGTAR